MGSLTQRICLEIAGIGIPCPSRDVDAIVRRLYIEDEVHGQDGHLLFIQQRVLDGGDDRRAEVLTLYRKILRHGNVPDDETVPAVSRLKLSGLTVADGGCLRVKNRIYQEIFNANWIDLHMPDAEARRQKTAYRQGALRAVTIGAAMYVALAGLTVWALRERTRAGIYLHEADTANKLAVQRLKLADRSAYNLTMNLVQKEWESGGVQNALYLLDSLKTSPYRGFEYGYWNEVCREEAARLPTHSWSVQAVDISPDGKLIATGSRDGFVRITTNPDMIVKTVVPGELPIIQGNRSGVTSVSFSRDGKYLAYGCDTIMAIMDVESGKVTKVLERNIVPASALAFSPDGKFLIAGMGFINSKDTSIIVHGISQYQVGTWKKIRFVTPKSDPVSIKATAFSPDSSIFATGSYDHHIRVWDTNSGQLLHDFVDPDNFIASVAFSADGKYLASGGKRPFVPEKLVETDKPLMEHNSNVRVWSLKTAKVKFILDGYLTTVKALKFTPDGKWLITGGFDNNIKIWDAETGALLRTIPGHSNPVVALAVTGDGKQLISGSTDSTARLWNLYKPSNPIVMHWNGDSRIAAASVSPDEKSVALALDHRPSLVDVLTGRQAIEVKPTRTHAGEPSAAEAILSLTDPEHPAFKQFTSQEMQVCSVEWSPDGKILVAAGSLGSVHQLNLGSSFKDIDIKELQPGVISSATISPDRTLLALTFQSLTQGAELQGTAAVVRIADGKLLFRRTVAMNTFLCVAWSPDAKLLALGGSEKRVFLIDTATFTEVRKLENHLDDIQSLSFSSDGKYLLSGSADNSICMWEAATGSLKQRMLGHHDNVNSACFSKDGTRVVSASDDGTVKVWDPESGQALLTLIGHRRAVRSAQFTADGTRIISAGWDNTIRIWSSIGSSAAH
jgi:WD40 repeat protein